MPLLRPRLLLSAGPGIPGGSSAPLLGAGSWRREQRKRRWAPLHGPECAFVGDAGGSAGLRGLGHSRCHRGSAHHSWAALPRGARGCYGRDGIWGFLCHSCPCPHPGDPKVSLSLSRHPAVLLFIPHEAPHLGGEPGHLVAGGWLLWLVEPVLCSCHLSHWAVSALANVLQLGHLGSPGVQGAAMRQSLCPGHSWARLCCMAWAGLAEPGTTAQV